VPGLLHGWMIVLGNLSQALRAHWPEYLMEAAQLGLFMMSAGVFTILIKSPASPIHSGIASGVLQRALIGVAMGLTSIVLVYSPWGRQSGAHLNPAVTFTFWRLGKVRTPDAMFYALAHFLGGVAGICLFSAVAGDIFRMPPVTFIATRPGPRGTCWALGAEIVISFLLMSTILFATNQPRLAKFTGVMSGALVALFVTFESPLSGMSMNPARTFGSALPAGFWSDLWIYFVAPVIGMTAAVEVRQRLLNLPMKACAKMYHDNDRRCIFCGRNMQVATLVLVLAASDRAASVGPIAIAVLDLDKEGRVRNMAAG
jgi:aquaporin Z